MRGKYSPTVNAAYCRDQAWHDKLRAKVEADMGPNSYSLYDDEGYDAFGYNSQGYDRAGNHEFDYAYNDAPVDTDEDYNDLYDAVSYGFDGVRPVKN